MANAPVTASISPARATELLRRADTAVQKLQKIKGKTEEKAGEVFKMLETVGGGLAVGCLRGRFGKITLGPGIPVEAVGGAVLHGIGFLDIGGKYSEHIHNLANSVLTTWSALEGVEMMGGAVLSKEDVEKLAAKNKTIVAQGEVVQQAAKNEAAIVQRPEPPTLINGRGTSARDLLEREQRETVTVPNGVDR